VTVPSIFHSCNFLLRSSWLLPWPDDLFFGIVMNTKKHSVWILNILLCVILLESTIIYIFIAVYIHTGQTWPLYTLCMVNIEVL
jgi:hypothetical protein